MAGVAREFGKQNSKIKNRDSPRAHVPQIERKVLNKGKLRKGRTESCTRYYEKN